MLGDVLDTGNRDGSEWIFIQVARWGRKLSWDRRGSQE